MMRYDPDRFHRRSVRLRSYDYTAPGAYFVTIVTRWRVCLFGDVENGRVALNKCGSLVHNAWLESARIRPEIELDAFMVMPNHFHGIVAFHGVGAHGRAPLPPQPTRPGPCRQTRSLGSFIAGFKAAATTRVNALRGTPGIPVWQHSYYDHVVRGEEELHRIREYILNNPAEWDLDPENPAVNQAAMRPPHS